MMGLLILHITNLKVCRTNPISFLFDECLPSISSSQLPIANTFQLNKETMSFLSQFIYSKSYSFHDMSSKEHFQSVKNTCSSFFQKHP